MKNNCDVSGRYGDRAECTGEINVDGCAFWSPDEFSVKCKNSNCGLCYSLAAIRAAIEAEHLPRGEQCCANCLHMMRSEMHDGYYMCADSESAWVKPWHMCERWTANISEKAELIRAIEEERRAIESGVVTGFHVLEATKED